MKQKIYIISVIFLFFSLFIMQRVYAKYVVSGNLQMKVYIDKTPPIIDLTNGGNKETYPTTQNDVIKRTGDVKIDTRDNIKISYNEYYYNPSNSSFDGKTPTRFDSGKTFIDEGFYKIVAVDTSGNRTEIIFLIDNSAPEVNVRYYKKGEATSLLNKNCTVRQVAGVRKYMNSQEIIDSGNDENKENIELPIQIKQNSQSLMMVGAVAEMYVGNEAEFRNALNNQAATIRVRQSINFTSPVYITYPVTVVDESDDNALRYGSGGSFIIVQNGGSLTITGMVVDLRSSGAGGMTAINIQSGGTVTFNNSSIVDGGTSNTGILVNGGATLNLYSCEIVYCGYGINLQSSGKINFLTQTGRGNNFYNNSTALFIDNFSSSVAMNQNICMHDNTNAVQFNNGSGTLNISAGTYYNNTYGIHTINGKANISGGDYYSNGWAVWVGGNVNMSGGSFHNNYYGVLTDGANSGKFTMTGGSIYSNTGHAIQHQKTNNGGCTITGGSISGDIYLASHDNYVNTNSSYPTFTVTPSEYFNNRKLVRTSSNSYANNENSRVTLTPKDDWFKKISDEYIVLANKGSVIIRCKDYYGNVIKQETKSGTIGSSYSVSAPTISGYELVSSPSNTSGTYTKTDIIVEFKYDLPNVAKVTFEDLLSGVVSAKYWYNANSQSFSGNGTEFSNGKVFENYGYYKVVVTNGVGLQKEITFSLNSNSYTR